MATSDPRSVAREIPGLFDAIFPQLTPGVVAHFNRTAQKAAVEPVPDDLVDQSDLQRSMLFELGFAAGEMILADREIDWNVCLGVAAERQKKYFDAKIPAAIGEVDREIAERVGKNIAEMVRGIARARNVAISIAPKIPGFQWIASGNGDFAAGQTIIEVKCIHRNFSAPDYRQVAIYWLLSFAQAVEANGEEWTTGALLNPRSTAMVKFQFDELLHIISAGRTKIEILELFSSMVGTRGMR